MIEYIRFNSGYPSKLPQIGRRKINFKERITVLYGPNGTGKTTILKALAEKTGCSGGGWSEAHRIDNSSGCDLKDDFILNNRKSSRSFSAGYEQQYRFKNIADNAERNNSDDYYFTEPYTADSNFSYDKSGIINLKSKLDVNTKINPEASFFDADIKWDGKPVFYQDCYSNSETSFFNNDFFNENELLRSSGEKRIGLINELINFLEDRFLTYKTKKGEGPTLLLDEVDNHIGFAGQSLLWKFIFPLFAKKYQIIISTHSVFPLLLRRDDVVALCNSYPDSCLKELGEAIDKYNKK